MSDNSAQSIYTNKPEETHPVEGNNSPSNLVDAVKQTVNEPIQKNVGSMIHLTKGRDYDVVRVRVVNSTFKHAEDHEKAIYIAQGRSGISVSLASLEEIINWAKTSQ